MKHQRCHPICGHIGERAAELPQLADGGAAFEKAAAQNEPQAALEASDSAKKLRMWQAEKDVKWIIVNSEPGHLLWRAPYFMEQNRGRRRGLTFLDADKSARRSHGGAICTLSHSWVNIVQRDFFLNSLLSESARKAR